MNVAETVSTLREMIVSDVAVKSPIPAERLAFTEDKI